MDRNQTNALCKLLKEFLSGEAMQLLPELRGEFVEAARKLKPMNLEEWCYRLMSRPEFARSVERASILPAELRLELRKLIADSAFENVEKLPAELSELLQSIKVTRGDCPSAEDLVEYESLSLATRRDHRIHSHVRFCSSCLLLLQHMSEPSG